MADEVTIDIRVLGSAEAVAATQQVQAAQQQLAAVTTSTAQQATHATQQASTAQLSHWQNFTQGLQSGWQQAAQQATTGSAAVGAATTTGLTAALGPSSPAAAAAATHGTHVAGGFWSGLTSAFTSSAGTGGVAAGLGASISRGLGIVGIGLAAKELFGFLRGTVDDYAAAEQAAVSLEDAYSRFPKLAGANAQAIMELTKARQMSTRFDDDESNAAAARLAQLNLTDEQLRGLIPLTQDYAAKSGKSVESAAGSISSAFLGNSRALRDIGIQFKATGSLGYDYTKMVQLLNEQVGGFAEKDGAAASGRIAELGNRWGEIKETIGKYVLPVFEQVAEWFLNLMDWAGPPLGKLMDLFGAIWTLVRPLAVFIGDVLGGAFTILGKTIEGILWIFTKVADGIKWLWDHSIGAIIDGILAAAKFVGKVFSSDPTSAATLAPTIGDTGAVNPMAYGAKGFVLPGYAPGVDSIDAKLAPGEGVLVPEVVRAIGPDAVHRANAWGVSQRFAFGGIAGQSPSYAKSPLEQALAKASWQSVFIPNADGGTAVGAPSMGEHSGTAPGAVPTGDPVERWRALATQALQMTGQYTPENLTSMMNRLRDESSGNPNAINNWDRNAKNGTPSQGLMQVIQPTFDAYAMPGYDKNLLDPLSNMLASINYATKTYGSLNAAYNRKNADGSVAGYDSGGWLPPGGIAVSGLDKPEAVLTPDQWDTMRSAADRPSAGTQVTIQPGAFVISGVRDSAEVVALLEREFPRIVKSYTRDRNTKEL